jgi:hypothetical protein
LVEKFIPAMTMKLLVATVFTGSRFGKAFAKDLAELFRRRTTMEIGRNNAAKSTIIPSSNPEPAQQPQEQKVPSSITQAKDTFVTTPPPNDLSRALGEGKQAQLKDIVTANEQAAPQFGDLGTSQNKEHYGTNIGSIPSLDHPNRFGFDDNSQNEDLIGELNRRAGFGFDPHRDLRISPDDAASSIPNNTITRGINPPEDKNPIRGNQSQADIIKQQQDEIKQLKSERDSYYSLWMQSQIDKAYNEAKQESDRLTKKAQDIAEKATNAAKNPNPDAPDNSGGGPFDPLINNLGSSMRVRNPFVDPTLEQEFGPSGVMKGRDQAVDPNPDADPNEGAARKAILSTSDAVTDPNPDLNSPQEKLNGLKNN